MHNILLITDTSCLIALSKLNELDILNKLYTQVIVTEEIVAEFGEPLPEWIEVHSVTNKNYQQLLEATLDKGEASAIALAVDMSDTLLVLDDLKGRKEAIRLGLKLTGTLGILMRAKQKGIIKLLKPLLETLETEGFRLNPNIIKGVLEKFGE